MTLKNRPRVIGCILYKTAQLSCSVVSSQLTPSIIPTFSLSTTVVVTVIHYKFDELQAAKNQLVRLCQKVHFISRKISLRTSKIIQSTSKFIIQLYLYILLVEQGQSEHPSINVSGVIDSKRWHSIGGKFANR